MDSAVGYYGAMKKERELTFWQKRWLEMHGGRNAEHVEVDEKGKPFVLMFDPKAELHVERVYLP